MGFILGVLAGKKLSLHTLNIERQHLEIRTVVPVSIAIESTILSSESKHGHDESTSTASSSGIWV
jgi:hypothetical protein